MEKLFLHLVNMSISVTPLILLVMLARLFLKRSPRWVICLMWAVVGLRLICPVSLESPLGLMPSQPLVTPSQVNGVLSEIIVPEMEIPEMTAVPIPAEEAPSPVSFSQAVAYIWAAGLGGMAAYLVLSLIRLRYLVREAVPVGQCVWLCDGIAAPFILGMAVPRIYLPSGIREQDIGYVIAHERAHLKRLDHIWKPLGFVLLAVYWFHPLVWAAYLLLCRDIELACDERVIRDYTMAGKKAYSTALLECSTSRRLVFACPLAFGEVAIKARIQNVLKYRKPAFWIIALSLVLILAGALCFMTAQPKSEEVPEAVVPSGIVPPVQTEETRVPAAAEETLPAETDGQWSAYPDGVRIDTYRGDTFTAQIMIVRDPARVSLGTSSDYMGDAPGKRLEEAIEEKCVIGAVNAGAFFDDGTASDAVGAVPWGTVYSGGSCVWEEEGPMEPGFAGFTEDNILVVHDSLITREQAEALNIRDGCSYGPALIINGEINQEAYRVNNGYNPRTAIGQRPDGAVIFICVNGRQAESLGCTYGDLIDMMVEYGAVSACNMTGGSATGMMYLDTYGAYGDPGEILTLTTYPIGQARSRRIPTYWQIWASTPAEPMHMLTLYAPNEDATGLICATWEVSEISGHAVFEALKEAGVLEEDAAVNALIQEGELLKLDVNEAFAQQLRGYGTAGEYWMLGSVVNSLLGAYPAESVLITVNGSVLETGHAVYDFPLEFYQG